MELLHFAGIVALGVLLLSGVYRCDDSNPKEADASAEDKDKCFTVNSILDLVKDLEEEMDSPAALVDLSDKNSQYQYNTLNVIRT